jgi:hypothetical protein
MVKNQQSSPAPPRFCRIDQIGSLEGEAVAGVPIKMDSFTIPAQCELHVSFDDDFVRIKEIDQLGNESEISLTEIQADILGIALTDWAYERRKEAGK